MENNIDKAAILIAESVATMVEALGMKADNEVQIQQGYSAVYIDKHFYNIAENLRDKVKVFKIETETK